MTRKTNRILIAIGAILLIILMLLWDMEVVEARPHPQSQTFTTPYDPADISLADPSVPVWAPAVQPANNPGFRS